MSEKMNCDSFSNNLDSAPLSDWFNVTITIVFSHFLFLLPDPTKPRSSLETETFFDPVTLGEF